MSRGVLSILDRAAGGLFPYSTALSAEVLEARATVERMAEALERIAGLCPTVDSDEGLNEWGEADCFRQAQLIAAQAVAAYHGDKP